MTMRCDRCGRVGVRGFWVRASEIRDGVGVPTSAVCTGVRTCNRRRWEPVPARRQG